MLGAKKAEQDFLEVFAEMFAEASNDMQAYIEELANLEDNNDK